MNYEQKYKEALERAKTLYENANGMILKKWVKRVFPELTESEDERVRKEVIHYFTKGTEFLSFCSVSRKQILTWLEKQGEHTDKIEPKFHEGDWVVSDKNNVVRIKSIDSNYYVLENTMRFTIDYVDKCWHLWSIQDAKDGDVLINWNNTIFIFKDIEDESVKFHIAYNEKWDAIKTPSTKLSHMGLPEPQFEFHPATKEQRDTLMKAMTDAGYEWDAEKKELKKIEQNAAVVIPKFRVGDIICPKGSTTKYTIESISGGCYCGNLWRLPIGCDDDYELVEQKSADKIETKFKVGDIIINKENGIISKINNILPYDYELISFETRNHLILDQNVINGNSRLWTIQDAKNGDILRIKNLTFIFQEITNNNACHKDAVVACCSYEDNDDAFGTSGPDCITDLEIITPATKEQRDLLFQKMNEAGCEWDSKNKKLILE